MKHLSPKTGIHCPTRDLDQKVREVLPGTWASGVKWADKSAWKTEEDVTCIIPSLGTYCNISGAIDMNYTIIPAQQFLNDNTEEKPLRGELSEREMYNLCMASLAIHKLKKIGFIPSETPEIKPLRRLSEMTELDFQRYFLKTGGLPMNNHFDLHYAIAYYGTPNTYFLLEQAGFDVRFKLKTEG